ncbi:unnamed protein product [Darwinula stevensoni]|uniref:NAD(+) ADP-ribosyltransferase n=1 Tax=Darwinula stevensoni TaxID=69355 RepID=A0A7R9ADC8_9CRUS|nr:unnamed protein product [Darwinula stevensoni]CAG0900849.1 unnamed protein product [Darwinula stevensoni]
MVVGSIHTYTKVIFTEVTCFITQTKVMVKEEDGGPPLKGLKFVIDKGVTEAKQKEVELKKFGATIVKKVDATVAAVISTPEVLQKQSRQVKHAAENQVHVVGVEFLQELSNNSESLAIPTVCDMIQKQSICSWGSDPRARIDATGRKSAKKKSFGSASSMFTKSVPSSMKMRVKGGGVVDPESELEDVAHVLKKGGTLYAAVLGMVDMTQGTNSYYKLQILRADQGPQGLQRMDTSFLHTASVT